MKQEVVMIFKLLETWFYLKKQAVISKIAKFQTLV